MSVVRVGITSHPTAQPPISSEESSTKKTRPGFAKTTAVKVKERDPLFDVMAEATGHDLIKLTEMGGKTVGIATSQVRKLDADPAEVWQKAELYRSQHPTWELTPMALAKHWATLRPAMRSSAKMKPIQEFLASVMAGEDPGTAVVPQFQRGAGILDPPAEGLGL